MSEPVQSGLDALRQGKVFVAGHRGMVGAAVCVAMSQATDLMMDLKTGYLVGAIPRKQRAMVRKGIKAGLVGEPDPAIDNLYEAYSQSVRNLGTPVFAKRHFQAIRDEFGDDVDRPVKKSDGSWTYFAPDIAYHYDKVKRGFDQLIDVFGADHGGYVKRMQAAVKALSQGDASLDIRLCQLVNLMDAGQPFKMSKRAGRIVTDRRGVGFSRGQVGRRRPLGLVRQPAATSAAPSGWSPTGRPSMVSSSTRR